MRSPDFARDGAQLFAGEAAGLLLELHAMARGLPPQRAGVRMHNNAALTRLLAADGAITSRAAAILGRPVRPVRALLFDKIPDKNWSLAWHQDRTICVRERKDVAGFGPWTVKRGLHHVTPPVDVLERMVTMRVHLDNVPPDNAPLRVALGSHRLGSIAEREIDEVVNLSEIYACTADPGDIWAYATLIVHASDAAKEATNRRVLHVDFSGDELPGGLEWLGV